MSNIRNLTIFKTSKRVDFFLFTSQQENAMHKELDYLYLSYQPFIKKKPAGKK